MKLLEYFYVKGLNVVLELESRLGFRYSGTQIPRYLDAEPGSDIRVSRYPDPEIRIIYNERLYIYIWMVICVMSIYGWQSACGCISENV